NARTHEDRRPYRGDRPPGLSHSLVQGADDLQPVFRVGRRERRGRADGLQRKGLELRGARALVVGCGGVGCAIAASLAAAGIGAIALYDIEPEAAAALAQRLRTHYPAIEVTTGSKDPAGMALAVNATPLGMNTDDPLPLDVSRLESDTFVGEVVMKSEVTPLLAAAQARGCRVQVG